MKLPSIDYLIKQATNSVLRFPMVIASAIAAMSFAIFLVEYKSVLDNSFPYINAMLCAFIGIPLFFSVQVLIEKKIWGTKERMIGNLIVTALLVVLYFTFPNTENTLNTSLPYIKYAIYNIAAHLIASFIPYLFIKQLNGFWNYNKTLFIRFVTSVIFSGILFLGILLALQAIRLLFDVKFEDKVFGETWMVVAILFNVWFFLSGIPTNFDELETITVYPKEVKILAQYILLPLLGIYIIILYAYGGKIIINWDWPRGIASYLITGISVLGVFTFLLLHPFGKQTQNSWIKNATRSYYFLLIPLVILLFIAISMRLEEYGITINRYCIFALGVWLSIQCIYAALGYTNIKFVPTSLAGIVILTSFGPWGMFSVSEHSQVNRLKVILEQNNLMKNGHLITEVIWNTDSLPKLLPLKVKKNIQLPDSIHNEIYSIISYLDSHHGFSLIKPWYSQNMDTILLRKEKSSMDLKDINDAEIFMTSLGLPHERKYKNTETDDIQFNSDLNTNISQVSGFDYITKFSQERYDVTYEPLCKYSIDQIPYWMKIKATPKVEIILYGSKQMNKFSVHEMITNIQSKYGSKPDAKIPLELMTAHREDANFYYSMQFENIYATSNDSNYELKDVSGMLLIKKKSTSQKIK